MQGPAIRPATPADLPALRTLFSRVVARMDAAGVPIWSDAYPYDAIVSDVERGEYFVAEKDGALVGGYQLGAWAANCEDAPWEDPSANAAYLGRLGVDPAWQGRGLGRALCKDAGFRARYAGAQWLRLFVVDNNAPAIGLYEACGFVRRSGIFQLDLGQDLLFEYPYELNLSGLCVRTGV